jgi:hypothetical protein
VRSTVISGVLLLALAAAARAQSPNASVSGQVTDPSGARIADATVVVVDVATNTRYETRTTASGDYHVVNLPPARYDMSVTKQGFRPILKPAVVLHVQNAVTIDFTMTLGSLSDHITVDAGAPLLRTSDAGVSTLVDNRFVADLPLNGRSFSSLISLTPGVVLTASNFFEQGQFSVNGQRPDDNYFMVDGVGANLGTGAPPLGQGGAGQLPATSAFGGTSNLVSLDALQEFRIHTSTFAPEYGRSPGAQVSVVTKSGTNAFHGNAFEYFRHDALDANNWFANARGLAKPALRQHDFGGTLDGPVLKNALFFFGSYERLIVRQPQVANTYVPSLVMRENVPAAVQPLLHAFPLPTGGDLGNGIAAFSAGYSDPSTLDASSARVDYRAAQSVSLFGRYNSAPSRTEQRTAGATANYNTVLINAYRFQSLTVGSNQVLASRTVNEFRFNYSRSRVHSFQELDDFGGGIVPNPSALLPPFATPQTASFGFFADSNPVGLRFLLGERANNLTQQFNIADTLSRVWGRHELKVGLDYRRIRADGRLRPYDLLYDFQSLPNVLANRVQAVVNSRTPAALVFPNLSLFAQDTWRISPALTMTYGVRWEYDGAPASPNDTLPMTVTQVSDFATMALAPSGTPLWHAHKDNIAPRVDLAWRATPTLVIRTGTGVFYGLGYSSVANAVGTFPYLQRKTVDSVPFPLSAADAAPPPFKTTPPIAAMIVVDPNHVLPRTYQWNAAIERSLGSGAAVTLTYVGAEGRRLMRRDAVITPNPLFNAWIELLRNASSSSYDALQVQFVHRLNRGLQALLSYTWAHSVDTGSSDSNFQSVGLGALPSSPEHGPSDFDVRHTLSAAMSYDIPGPRSGAFKQLLEGWSTDSIVRARSAPPVNVVTGQNVFSIVGLGAPSLQRPNVVPGVPFYLDQPLAPGGTVINPDAFSLPARGQGNLGRNALRGFGATQWDLTLRRRFRIGKGTALQVRADLFNVLNHPNFGSPIALLSSPQFGQATQMLANSLGSGGQNGGLNPLYQIGGPRSIQLGLKLQF